MFNKVRINKRYPFKQMSPGETLKLGDADAKARILLSHCL
jgi:hypothetical protein